MNIANVEVSIHPDLIIRGTIRGQKVIGAAKIHLIKNSPLGKEGQINVASVVHNFVEEYLLQENERCEPRLCLSVDIFPQTIECGPKAFITRRKQILSACEEIAARWKNL